MSKVEKSGACEAIAGFVVASRCSSVARRRKKMHPRVARSANRRYPMGRIPTPSSRMWRIAIHTSWTTITAHVADAMTQYEWA